MAEQSKMLSQGPLSSLLGPLKLATVLKATPFLSVGILQETGPPHQNALAHFISNEFMVFNVIFMSV